ncbi:MAG: GlmU family protein [Flavobacteriaceae bacterium]|nr:GlmU family protein [Flavobacteriaceae bacterium]
MNVILFDSDVRNALLPLTYTRPVADIRVGILTLREKWENLLSTTTTTITEDYLTDKYPMVEFQANIMVNASFIPTLNLAKKVRKLKENEALLKNGTVIAFFTSNTQEIVDFSSYNCTEVNENILQIKNVCDIFKLNEAAIKLDFEIITKGRVSQPIPDTVHCINKENIFLEEGAKVEIAVLNASKGPIYIGKEAEIMEACMIRGPFAMGQNSLLKMGAKIYGATTLGPHCKVGGEVNNSVFFGYSNKAHDGFLGNSVIGEWCNLGADTNNSNLKNNYANVKLWHYETERFKDTGLQFCGLIMGDHSKCGINTMFNTGTIVGVSANIYGGNFPRNFIPSFSWGGSAGFTEYKLPKVFEVASKVMARKGLTFTQQEQDILTHVYNETAKYRNY